MTVLPLPRVIFGFIARQIAKMEVEHFGVMGTTENPIKIQIFFFSQKHICTKSAYNFKRFVEPVNLSLKS